MHLLWVLSPLWGFGFGFLVFTVVLRGSVFTVVFVVVILSVVGYWVVIRVRFGVDSSFTGIV